jgi:hypothetical protein
LIFGSCAKTYKLCLIQINREIFGDGQVRNFRAGAAGPITAS